MKPWLISPLHDPQGTHLEIIKKWGSLLPGFYSLIVVGATDQTDLKVLNELEHLKVVIRQGDYSYGEGYRQALACGLKKGGKIFHCSDFDRILHWVSSYPEELKNLLKKPPLADYLVLGRTKRAFATHPLSWRLTEKIDNTLISKALGFEVDICAGSAVLNQKSARTVLANSKESGFSILAEWPLLVQKAGLKVSYSAVEGYEWEDPDRFQKEIKEGGYQEWLKTYDHPDEWRKRIKSTNQKTKVILENLDSRLGKSPPLLFDRPATKNHLS